MMWGTAQVVLLNTVFWPLMLLVTLLYAILATPYILGFALCTRDRRCVLWLLRRTITWYGRSIILCAWPFVRVQYVDLAPEDEPPFVCVSNHRAASDAYLMAVLPLEAVQVVNIWPFKIPLLGPVAKLAGYLSVREMPIEAFIERGTSLLGEGVTICTFPEGTRSGSRTMGSFHSSPFKLALAAGARLVPLAISGNERTPARGSLLLRPARVRVHKLKALDPATSPHATAYALKTRLRERLQLHLDEMEGAAA